MKLTPLGISSIVSCELSNSLIVIRSLPKTSYTIILDGCSLKLIVIFPMDGFGKILIPKSLIRLSATDKGLGKQQIVPSFHHLRESAYDNGTYRVQNHLKMFQTWL